MAMAPSDLYGLPLDRFTPERNALAKQLRRDGQPEESARVAKLRKPSVAAWAVNQLVRTQRQDIQQLYRAGDAAQRAQAALIKGQGQAEGLREAAEAERQAVERLTDAARGLLGSQGEELSQVKLQQVSETLHAAALDSDARELVKDGCLERELRHVGLGALAGGQVAPRRSGKPAPRKPTPAKSRQPRRPAAESRGPSPTEQLRSARQAEGETRRRAERAQRDLRRAQERREQAAEALRASEQQLAEALESAARADDEYHRAQQEVEQLKRRTRAPRRR